MEDGLRLRRSTGAVAGIPDGEGGAASALRSSFQSRSPYAVPGRLAIPTTAEARNACSSWRRNIEPELAVLRAKSRAAEGLSPTPKFALPKGLAAAAGRGILVPRRPTFVGTGRLPLLSPSEEHELGFRRRRLPRQGAPCPARGEARRGPAPSRNQDRQPQLSPDGQEHARARHCALGGRSNPGLEKSGDQVDLTSKTAPTRQNVDDKRGVLSWETKLRPDQEQVVEFGYRVSWPAAKSVVYGR